MISPEEEAYRDSDEMLWRGRRLEPYSFLRRTAAIALVRYFGGNMPEPVLAVWLALQSDEKARMARRDPAAVEAEIDAWADRENILTVEQEQLLPDAETRRVYEQIMSGILASTPEPADEAQKKSDIVPAIPQTTSQWLPPAVGAQSPEKDLSPTVSHT